MKIDCSSPLVDWVEYSFIDVMERGVVGTDCLFLDKVDFVCLMKLHEYAFS